MAKAAKAKAPVAAPALTPLELSIREYCDIRNWFDTGQFSETWQGSKIPRDAIKRMESLRVKLRDSWLELRPNSPWEIPGWQLEFVSQDGKSYTAPCVGCRGQTLKRDPEWHIKPRHMADVS